VTCWGTGKPLREFLHVDDLGEACVFALERWQPAPEELQFLNVGTGLDLSIRELAEAVAAATGFTGEILWDASKPDGSRLAGPDFPGRWPGQHGGPVPRGAGAAAGAALTRGLLNDARGRRPSKHLQSWLSWLRITATAAMQVNMLEAKSQLSRLVKAALAGEEVIIASHGKAQVKLVACVAAPGLKQPGAMAAASPALTPHQLDAAFSDAMDQEAARLFGSTVAD
jgi:antitoxin (DNA-binding transcriptional repressor) of toxin-antitoxin stability system